MRFSVFLILLINCFFVNLTFGQYANDWINYSQKYYSIKIWQDGIYKIDQATLSSAGVPTASILPSNFQLFGFQKEQEILVEDGGDGSFDAGDYILFYGQKNTTWLDSIMYESSANIANKFYPHYNDTINYFLTWNNSTANSRMQVETDVAFASYPPFPYYLTTSFIESHGTYAQGENVSGMSYSTYTAGEGWVNGPISATSGAGLEDKNVPSSNAYTGAGAPLVKAEVSNVGYSNAVYSGLGNHHLRVLYSTSNIIAVDTIFSGYQHNRFNFQFPSTSLGGTTTRIRHQLINDLGLPSDLVAVSYAELIYPHTTNMGNVNYSKFGVPFNTSEPKTRYDLTNFNAPNPIAFALNGGIKKIPVVLNAGTHQLLVPNLPSGEEQKIVVLNETAIQNVTQLYPVNGTGTFTNFSALSYDDVYLMVTGDQLWSSALDYKTYRESPAGGGFNVLLVNERELTMQFAGGVSKHPFGIRNFVKFAYESATVKPNNLFLLGKGIREANENVTSQAGVRQNGGSYYSCIVPAIGFPCSDNLLTYDLSANGKTPLIPTGRLAAKNNNEVAIYLNKMIEYEANQDPNSVYNVPDKLWQKDVLHFGGGSTYAEQYQFKNYLAHYELSLEDVKFGGHVNSFYKTVSDPIDPVTLYEVTDYINSGVSFMTFFGHASADGFDQNVDDPANWDNKGKYPITVGNACLTGNIFEPTAYSASEKYVLIEDKGSIAFLANVKQAFSNSLHDYSEILFDKIADENYGNSLGSTIKLTVDQLLLGQSSFGNDNVMSQMTLHGDPALKPNSHLKPELEINSAGVFITPESVDLSVDSIDVNIIVYNLGMATNDTFSVELTRHFPNNGPDSTYTKLVGGLKYVDTIVFTIPFYNNIGIGINEFTVEVDQPSFIDEQYDEIGNNQLVFQEIFDVDGIYPVWPYDYAVVPKDTITLKGSTVNPFADFATYRFEIDTTDLFNSPQHRYASKLSLGGVVEVGYDEWLNAQTGASQQLILGDSTVYFWRVAVEDTGSYYWIEASFQHINNKTGWGQDHFFQFKNNDFLFLNYDRPLRKRTFGPAFRTIDCDVFGNATAWLETAFTLYHIDGEIAEYNFCSITPQLLVCVIDPTTLKPWGTYYDWGGGNIENPNNNFGNHNNNGGCRPRPEYHFSFWQNNPVEMDAFDNMIANEIPDGHYVLIYTARYADYANWDIDNFNTFASLGADSINSSQTANRPFVIFTQKGNTGGTAITVQDGGTNEVYGSAIDADITLIDTLWGFDYYGAETSTVIGPSTEWQALYWKLDSLENPSDDSTRIQLWGQTWSGISTQIFDTLVPAIDSIINLNGLVDAQQYPYLQLNMQTWDKTNFSPAQLDSWHVIYQDVPEAAINNASANLLWEPGDTLYEGQDIAVSFDIDNISDLPMDSLLISYWIEDANHVKSIIPYPRQDSLRVGSTIRDTITVNSNSFVGLNSFWVEVNPYVSNGQTDQIEKYHFNNLAQLPFVVTGDNENPILDVTFNGYHILNGDIVDPASEVIITLKDDNPYLLMNAESDTANFGIYLTSPDGIQTRLNFRNSLGEPLMEWIPADASNKKFKIIFKANFDQEGTYRLLVQGVDKSGNLSGDFEYDIEFEVDHHSSITNLMNYPNPFTTSTRFVFTLTGAIIPDEFTIQIMNVSGTVVREITKHELGDIQIGRNISEFEWNGTDEFGDKLARGVYLYRVIVKIDGQDVEHRESGADQYFTKSFGKMYLL